jgi:hypothetical protein
MKTEDRLLKFKWPTRKLTNHGSPPYGYTVSDNREEWIPNPEVLDALEVAKDLLENGLSTRDCVNWLCKFTDTKLSHQGFIKRIARDNKFFTEHKDTTFDQYTHSKEDYGDGTLYTPKAKPKAKAQQNGRAKKVARLKGKTKAEKDVIRKTHQISEATKIITRNKNQLRGLLQDEDQDVEALSELIPESLEDIISEAIAQPTPEEDLIQEIIFQAHPGPQTDFLASIEDVIFYGGAKGGGKTYALIADPLRYCHHKDFRALILRRTMPELRDMIRHTQLIYPKVFPGAKWLKTEKTWEFPSGATLEFGYCETEDDAERYRGQSFHWCGIDELPQYAHRGPFDALMSCLRSANPEIPVMMRCTGNPGNIGSGWVKKEFIDPAAPNTRFYKRAMITDPRTGVEREVKKSFKYIPATVYDNPSLLQDDNYLASLALLPEVKRKQMLEGNWDIIEHGAFPDFDRSVHVVQPFEIPGNWKVWRAADWGFATPFCLLYLAADFDDNVYVFREWYGTRVYDSDWATKITEIEQNEKIYCEDGVIDGSVSTSRGSKAEDSLVVINRILSDARLKKFRKADRSAGSRKEGKLSVHRHLALKETGRYLESGDPELGPSLFIFDTCTDLIRTLPALMADPNDPEVVLKKNSEDHAYDALHYGLRAHKGNSRRKYAAMETIKKGSRPADKVFGY